MMERKYYNYTVFEDGRVISPSGLEKKQSISTQGYKVVNLYYNKGSHPIPVHRLVATLFVSLPYGVSYKDCIVEHIDGDRLNNHYKNLRWVDTRGMGCTHFRMRAVEVEVTHPDGTTVTYPSMNKAAKAEHVSMLTAMNHANEGSMDSRGRKWKRL